jgi:hypothetical protein
VLTCDVQVLQGAALLCPNDDKVHYKLGSSLVKMGKVREGMEALRAAVSINEDHVTAWATMGNLILEHNIGDIELSIDNELHQGVGGALEGALEGRASVPCKALVCFEHVLRLCPRDAEMRALVERLRQLEHAVSGVNGRPAVERTD